MRKEAIVREYSQLPVSGVFNMHEKANFLCGKMMDIEDQVRVSYNFTSADVGDLNTNPTQNSYVSSLNSVSSGFIKQRAIRSLTENKTQSATDRTNLTKWIFEFDSNFLLREYLYNEIYTLNPDSPFKQIPLSATPNNKTNTLCLEYIDKNIIDRYKLKEFILWTSYFELKNGTVPGTGTDPNLNPEIKLLYKTPVYSFNAIPNVSAPDSQKEPVALKQYNDGLYEISYQQKKSSQYYTFLWYYDAIYERI